MTMLTFRDNDLPQDTAPVSPHLPVQGQNRARSELTYLLFNGDEQARVHGAWRNLLSTGEFRHRPGLSPAERVELSYSRLRLVNEAAGSPTDLALDPQRLSALHEWTGVVDGGLCTLASIHYNLFLGSLLEQDADSGGRDLSAFTEMRRTGTFLCTELGHGNDAAALETTAEYDRETGGFILHTPNDRAQKFMPNTSLAGGPKSAVVAARLVIDGEDQGAFLFLTPLSDENGHLPGVHVKQLPDRTGTPVDHCLTRFHMVRLPREALLEAEHGRLDREGLLHSTLGSARKRFLHSIGRVTSGKLCMSAGTLGMSRAALTIAVRHAHSRHISGMKRGERIPLVAHRSHHSRLLDSIATAYAMTLLHREVVSQWVGHTPENRADTERLVAITKGWITWQARAIAIESRERCGAQGLFPVNGISELPLNIEGGITAEGDNLVIWNKAASEMLFGHQMERRRACDEPLAERSLTDLGFLRDLLAEVESDAQRRARSALRQGPAGDPLGRWNEASETALEMVSAHVCREAADAFIAAAARAADPTARSLLEDLCRLFLLRQLDSHTGRLLAEGHLTADHVRAFPDVRNDIIAGLAPHMLSLVDAFDLPAEFLATVPIASGGRIGDEGDMWSTWPRASVSASTAE
ncbi:acyl-CoA dehydrogenase [Streptomyces sp. AK02-01A]|uniref:acyl-CoA dehydrogenase family protein n=1 Tax=Streptomyces sp. AK02-01A TaxID=3028648 RepID=UPI0029A303C3|nr:acyl-CoA dehydrogenase [Streptomyces sp. AK02-01A]MDX3851936.1 acyl-CoA dehydrogenase [Streptomyces sp. AK02-01A]